MGEELGKNAGEKMEVSPIMLLKTNVEKMSETGLAIMFMKTKVHRGVTPLYL
jgi:hypothetical protein